MPAVKLFFLGYIPMHHPARTFELRGNKVIKAPGVQTFNIIFQNVFN